MHRCPAQHKFLDDDDDDADGVEFATNNECCPRKIKAM